MARPSRDKQRLPFLKYCIFGLFVLAVCYGFALAPTTSGQKRKSEPKAKSSPTPESDLERLGAPPPAPVLQKREQDVGPSEVISVETTEVMLPVTVRDGNGHLVSDLKREDF